MFEATPEDKHSEVPAEGLERRKTKQILDVGGFRMFGVVVYCIVNPGCGSLMMFTFGGNKFWRFLSGCCCWDHQL